MYWSSCAKFCFRNVEAYSLEEKIIEGKKTYKYIDIKIYIKLILGSVFIYLSNKDYYNYRVAKKTLV